VNNAAVAPIEPPTARTWSATDAHVRHALTAIKRGTVKTADELVGWDHDHGQRLFDWNDPTAAAWARRAQAILFFNRFRGVFDRMRIRALIHVREDGDAIVAIDESGYFPVDVIADHPGMRAQVIADLCRRMQVLASELRMWKLSPVEQADLFRRLADVIGDATE
jgi:beta-lactamase class D